MLQSAKAAFDVLQGIGTLASAGDVGRAKKRLLDSQIAYNKKQIQESLRQNYAAVLSKYASDRNDILIQRGNADSAIRMQLVQNTGDVDINESSFKGTSYGQLDKEFIEGMNTIRENNANQLYNLVEDTINKDMQLNIAKAQGHMQINQETEQAKAQAIKQITMGVADITGKYMESKALEEQKALTQTSNDNYKLNLMSGSQYYNNKGWGQYTKSNDNDPLKLKFFNY